VLVMGACSSEDAPTDPRDRYITALTTVFTRDDPGVDQDVGRCAATAMVDLVTTPTLTAAGVTPQQLADASDLRALGVALPADAADRLGDDFVACDLGEAMVAPFLRSMEREAGVTLDDAAVECVEEEAATDAVAAGMAVTFVGGTDAAPAFEAVLAAVEDCPDAASALGLSPA
jgi:hypothetical protein